MGDSAAASETGEQQEGLAIGLVGKTGTGKSSLGNALLKTEAFETSSGFDSETVTCESSRTKNYGRPIIVVDTPGTMDTENKEKALAELRNAILSCPYGFHAFLVVLQISRFTDEEYEGVQALRLIFGDAMMKYTIVVFTHADKVKNDEDKFNQDMVKARRKIPKLDALMNECGNRICMIDNSEKRDPEIQEKQIKKLIEAVDELYKKNGNKRYTNELFRQVQQELEQKRKMEEEKQRREEEMKRNFEAEFEKAKNEMEKQMLEQNMELMMLKLKIEHEKELREQSERFSEKMRETMEDRMREVKTATSRPCSLQ